MDLARFIEELKEFELDPESISTKRIYSEFLSITNTLDLSSTARCRAANASIASLSQAVLFKVGRCHYWEKRLAQQLDHARMKTTQDILAKLKEAQQKVGKEELEALVEVNEVVAELSRRLATANASRFFWEKISESLKMAGDRIENCVMSLGVDAKMTPRGN